MPLFFNMWCGSVRFLPNRTVGLSRKKIRTEPHRWPRFFKIKSFATVWLRCGAVGTAPHRTVRKSKNEIRTAPHRRTLQIEKPHRGSVLHREKSYEKLYVRNRAAAHEQAQEAFVCHIRESAPDSACDTFHPTPRAESTWTPGGFLCRGEEQQQ